MDTTNQWPTTSIPAVRSRTDAAWAGAPAIVVERLSKAYDERGRALAGMSLSVAQGEFFGLLGPHGSGKTSLVRILATLTRPDTGRASVLGYDVRVHATQVRARIGYVSQSIGIDEYLTGRENVLLRARLHGLRRQDALRRTSEVLSRLDLVTLGSCRAGRYPHSARKRLAIACGLVHHPSVLLLDEPTDGVPSLDRAAVWDCLRAVNRQDEVTIFLATHHLEEAESVCRRVAIIDGGKIIAIGAPSELKAQLSGVMVIIHLAAGERAAGAAMLLEHLAGVHAVWPHADTIELEVASAGTVPILLHLLEEHEIAIREISLNKPSLDEVFFRHTGRKIRDARERATGTGVPGRR